MSASEWLSKSAFNNPTNLMYWGWGACFLVGVSLYTLFQKKNRIKIFPYTNGAKTSLWDDVKIFIFYTLFEIFSFGFKASLQVYALLTVAEGFLFLLNKIDLPFIFTPMPEIAALLIYALTLDFGNFLSHYMLHKSPVLWEFHKVHHSATYLNPLTQFRSHPFELFFKQVVIGVITGFVVAILYRLNLVDKKIITVDRLWFFYVVYYVTAHLRHSHVWLSFGSYASYVFSSPAMHQLHHSTELRHKDKNMAIIFSVWDWMFGTLYIPRQKEEFEVGLSGATSAEGSEYEKGLRNHFLNPIKKSILVSLKKKNST